MLQQHPVSGASTQPPLDLFFFHSVHKRHKSIKSTSRGRSRTMRLLVIIALSPLSISLASFFPSLSTVHSPGGIPSTKPPPRLYRSYFNPLKTNRFSKLGREIEYAGRLCRDAELYRFVTDNRSSVVTGYDGNGRDIFQR